MKKILSIFAMAAILCGTFAACDTIGKDNEGTDGTEQTPGEGGENEGGEEKPQKEYIENVTVEGNTVTFNVNSEGKFGYLYTVCPKANVDEYLAVMPDMTVNDILDMNLQMAGEDPNWGGTPGGKGEGYGPNSIKELPAGEYYLAVVDLKSDKKEMNEDMGMEIWVYDIPAIQSVLFTIAE